MDHFYVCLVVLITLLISSASSSDKKTQLTEENHRVKRDANQTRELKVVLIYNVPYSLVDDSGGKDSVKATGFIPDVLNSLSTRLNYKFTVHPVPDGRYGSNKHGNGTWNGMIGELITGKADLAAAPLYITGARQEVVDFLNPFQHCGLSIVIQKPRHKQTIAWPYDFGIFEPFSPEMWTLTALSVIVVAMLLWALNRFNPYEWSSRFERGLASADQAEAFSLSGSLWFVFTTLQWQGFEKAPRSIASKILTCVWFAFVTITLVTYTGSLMNHLFWASIVHSRNPINPPFSNLEELVSQNEFNYGVIASGHTYQYLTEVMRGPEAKEIRIYWNSDTGQKQLVKSTFDGLVKVRSEKFAFIMETMMAKYLANKRPCDLKIVGEPFRLRSYGFAVPKKSPHFVELHQAILEMREDGELEYLERKWFDDISECWNETKTDKRIEKLSSLQLSSPKQVNLAMFWSGFVLLLLGICLTLIVATAEILYFKYRGRYEASNRPVSDPLSEDGNI